MSKRKQNLVDFLVYLAVRIVICIIQGLPMEVAYVLGDAIGWLGYLLDKRHRNVALGNLQQAFGDSLTEAQRRRMVLRVYRHFARVIVEVAFIPRKLRINNWKKYFTTEGGETIVQAFLHNRPMIIVTAHFGNWEMAGYFISTIGVESFTIARNLDNRYLHDFLLRFRQWSGQTILSKKGDFDRIQQVLADRKPLITVGDQSAGPRGLFVDFFGRPASTHKAIALLSLQYDAPIYIGFGYRDQPGFHYRVGVSRAIDPADYAEHPDATRAITADFTRELEKVIRRAPEQYLWLHNRWKHEPPKRVEG